MNAKSGVKDYTDIIDLVYEGTKTRTPMALTTRAAQFMPFAAVAGHDESVKEAARLTQEKKELDETAKSMLDQKLWDLTGRIGSKPLITITYYKADLNKEGGAYQDLKGYLKKVDAYTKRVYLMDGQSIPIEDILEIEEDYSNGE